MSYLFYFVLAFGLPHANWLPGKFDVPPDQIPLGLVNLIMLAAVALWLAGRSAGPRLANPNGRYLGFLAVVVISLPIALASGYEETVTTLTLAKTQIMLLLLYYVPLASVSDEAQFRNVVLLFLLVHLIVGVEVMNSGVLGGANYHDGKRGSGPFSEGLTGSDIAGSYLAQTLMFFAAFVLYRAASVRTKLIAGAGCLVLVFGIFATYSRGALVASVVGLGTMLPFLGLKPKFLVGIASLVLVGFLLAPESVLTRVDNTTSSSGAYDESTQGRFVYWETALGIVAEQPWGVGVGQVRGAFEQKLGKHVDTHNAFLYTACEYGIVGLIVFCLMLARFYQQALAVWREPGSCEIYRIYALGMAGMIGSFVACNFFYANFYKHLVMGTNTLHFGLLAYMVADISQRKGEIVQ